MAKVQFDRGNSSNFSNEPVQDGRFLYAQNTKKLYLDDSSERVILNPNPDWDALSGNSQILNKPGNATSSANGFMSSMDKSKLDAFSAASSYALKTDLVELVEYVDPGEDDPWDGIAFIPGIYPVVGTQNSDTGSWTGSLGLTALYDGLTIAYFLPRDSSGDASLNLTLKGGNTSGAVPVYYTGQQRATTQYSKGSTILLTYWSAGSISIDGVATTGARWTRCDLDTTYSTATSSASGLMSGSDKSRLDSMGITYTDNSKTLTIVL